MSTKFTNKDLRESLAESLGINKKEALEESYVAQQKPFNLRTEMLSDKNKRNHVELYQAYIDTFNRISAELDSVDRDEVNSNHCAFRSLKIDETYNLNAIYLH